MASSQRTASAGSMSQKYRDGVTLWNTSSVRRPPGQRALETAGVPGVVQHQRDVGSRGQLTQMADRAPGHAGGLHRGVVLAGPPPAAKQRPVGQRLIGDGVHRAGGAQDLVDSHPGGGASPSRRAAARSSSATRSSSRSTCAATWALNRLC